MRIAPPKTSRLEVRITDHEREMIKALASREEQCAADVVRGLIRDAYHRHFRPLSASRPAR